METSQAQKACPYCAEMIMAAAKKCKHCGEFLEQKAQTKPQVIEATGKTWKAVELIGALLIPLSLLVWAQASGAQGVPLLMIGCCMYFGAKIGGWWNHG